MEAYKTIAVLFLLILGGCQGGITGRFGTDVSCSMDVDIEFVEVDGEQKVCVGENYVEVVVDNKGVEVDGFIFNFNGTQDGFGYEVYQKIDTGEMSTISVPYNVSENGELERLEAVPVVEDGGVQSECIGQSIIATDFVSCE